MIGMDRKPCRGVLDAQGSDQFSTDAIGLVPGRGCGCG